MNAVRLVLSLWLALCCALAQADVVKVRAFDDIIERIAGMKNVLLLNKDAALPGARWPSVSDLL